MVFRVENEEGRGPYSIWDGYAVMYCSGGNRHPSPQSEGYNLRSGSAEVFGFTSLEQLERWFSPRDLRKLANEGFTVVKYDCEPHWESETQCTFFKK